MFFCLCRSATDLSRSRRRFYSSRCPGMTLSPCRTIIAASCKSLLYYYRFLYTAWKGYEEISLKRISDDHQLHFEEVNSFRDSERKHRLDLLLYQLFDLNSSLGGENVDEKSYKLKFFLKGILFLLNQTWLFFLSLSACFMNEFN